MGVRSRKKGISPLVAAVLLIAVTMTLAGILAYWTTNFFETSLPEQNQTETDCMYADFSIYSCTYFNDSAKVTLSLENTQTIELKDLEVYFIYSNSTISNSVPLNDTLQEGALKSYQLTGVTDPFAKLRVKTHCPDKSKEKACLSNSTS